MNNCLNLAVLIKFVNYFISTVVNLKWQNWIKDTASLHLSIPTTRMIDPHILINALLF